MISRIPHSAGARVLLLLAGLSALALGCQVAPTGRASAPTPTPAAPAARAVWSGRYAEHIQPVFDQHCVSCHGRGRADNGLRLDSYEGVVKGTQYGSVIAPGSAGGSTLLSVLKGSVAPGLRMPHDGPRLSDPEVQNITLWIEAGAPRN